MLTLTVPSSTVENADANIATVESRASEIPDLAVVGTTTAGATGITSSLLLLAASLLLPLFTH